MFIITASSCAGLLPSRRGYTALSVSANGNGRGRGSGPEDENRLIDQLDEEWDDWMHARFSDGLNLAFWVGLPLGMKGRQVVSWACRSVVTFGMAVSWDRKMVWIKWWYPEISMFPLHQSSRSQQPQWVELLPCRKNILSCAKLQRRLLSRLLCNYLYIQELIKPLESSFGNSNTNLC